MTGSVDALLTESMNRAFGVVVNDMRLRALRARRDSLTEEVSIDRLVALAGSFAVGQGGTPSKLAEADVEELEPASVPTLGDLSSERLSSELRKAVARLALEWNAKVSDGIVRLTVDTPGSIAGRDRIGAEIASPSPAVLKRY